MAKIIAIKEDCLVVPVVKNLLDNAGDMGLVSHALGQSPCATTTKAPVCPRDSPCPTRSHCNEKPLHYNKEWLLLPQLGKPAQAKDSATSKINKYIFFKSIKKKKNVKCISHTDLTVSF